MPRGEKLQLKYLPTANIIAELRQSLIMIVAQVLPYIENSEACYCMQWFLRLDLADQFELQDVYYAFVCKAKFRYYRKSYEGQQRKGRRRQFTQPGGCFFEPVELS